MMAANPSVHVFTSAPITSVCSLSVDTQQSSQIKIRNASLILFRLLQAKPLCLQKKKNKTKTLTPYVPATKRPLQGVTVHFRESRAFQTGL